MAAGRGSTSSLDIYILDNASPRTVCGYEEMQVEWARSLLTAVHSEIPSPTSILIIVMWNSSSTGYILNGGRGDLIMTRGR